MTMVFYSMRFKVVTCHWSDGATAIQLGYVLRLPHKEICNDSTVTQGKVGLRRRNPQILALGPERQRTHDINRCYTHACRPTFKLEGGGDARI